MWLSSVAGRIAGLWRGLPARWQGFILGTVVGTTLLSGSCALLRDSGTKDRIALENLKASLDSTRAIAAQHDTIYARLLVQKDVELTGALAKVAKAQHDKPKAVTTVTVHGRGLDTTAVHHKPVAVGDGGSDVGQAGPGHDGISDSLVLRDPPVTGVVKATVTDSTWIWSARLRPSPVGLTLALTCGKNGPEVLAHGPDWTSVKIATGQVAPTVCHPPSPWAIGVKPGVLVGAGGYVVLRLVEYLITKGK